MIFGESDEPKPAKLLDCDHRLITYLVWFLKPLADLATYPTILVRPSQNVLRSSRRRTLPEGLRGRVSAKSTLLGTL